jgi:probable rRNA maturation factor
MSSPEGSTVTFRRAPASLKRRGSENFARQLQQEVAKGRPYDCLITGDAGLRKLNRDFLGKDYPTDVLSFPEASVPGTPQSIGSLAISLGRARAQAHEFGHSIEDEVRILMLHGVLHLLGYNHESDRGRMARAERKWRARLALPNGLIERARS